MLSSRVAQAAAKAVFALVIAGAGLYVIAHLLSGIAAGSQAFASLL